MGKPTSFMRPVQGARVSQEDVGHTSSTRANGYNRQTKTKSSKTKVDRKARKTNHGEVSGDGETTEDDSNGDDEESSDEIDDNEADDEEPEVFAPSGGVRKGKQDENRLDSISDGSAIGSVSPVETANRQAGQTFAIGVHANATNTSRKRALSEMSANTILSTTERDHDGNEDEYPRKRVDRRLSNTADGILRYEAPASTDIEDDDDFPMTDFEEAIQSSDEDDESATLDDLDDSQDTDVEQLEELLIIQEESAKLEAGREATSHEIDALGLATDPLDSDDELPADLGSFWSSEMDMFAHADLFLNHNAVSDNEEDVDFSTPRPYMTNSRKQSDVSARRVRFEDEVEKSSTSSSSETDVDVFPDLMGDTFASQDNLPSSIRAMIENDIDFDVGNVTASDTEGSCWDFGEEQASENLFAWHDVHTESESEGGSASGSSLSGYDSDGDTTDDDLPPPATVRAPKSLLHRRSPSTINSVTHTPRPFPRSRRSHKGPVMGSFVVDERKAMAFIDPRTKQLRIQRARAPFLGATRHNNTPGSSASNSPQVTIQNLVYDSDNSELSRLLTGPSDVMMSGVFGGVPGQRYQDGRFVVEANGPLLIGPPEAFYPFASFRADGTPDTDSEGEFMTEDEFEDDCDILEAFFDMDEYDDEDDEPEMDEDDTTSPTTTDAVEFTPTQTGPPRNISEALMRNFDRGVVNSFRNNQDRYRQVSKLPHDMGSMSAPVRTGKTAEDLMTPPRKRKRTSNHDKIPRRIPVMGAFS